MQFYNEVEVIEMTHARLALIRSLSSGLITEEQKDHARK
jgi:hypothetical protein